jgi:hypothetical protein
MAMAMAMAMAGDIAVVVECGVRVSADEHIISTHLRPARVAYTWIYSIAIQYSTS